MTDPKKRDTTGPLPVGTVVDRVRRIIADQPDEAAVEAIVRAEVAERLAAKRAAAQEKIDALTARLTEPDLARYPKMLLAACDGELRGFGVVAGNDDEPASGRPAFLDDPPPPLRPGERTEVDRSAKGGR